MRQCSPCRQMSPRIGVFCALFGVGAFVAGLVVVAAAAGDGPRDGLDDSDSVFLQPQDFDLAETESVYRPSPAELDAIQNDELFEGDILGVPVDFGQRRMRDEPLPADDEQRIFGQPFHSSLNVDTYSDKLWPGGRIPYALEEGMTSAQRAAIAQAFGEYHEKTCIKFVPREPQDYDYIYIKRNLDFGCSSYVGRAGGNQTVSLEVKKCFSKGIIAHELMHAIGFFHEHSRTDRDDFVLIDEGNIRPGMMRNFEKYPRKVIDPLGMPYDYESIMHYHKLAFSRNGKPTIVPRNNTAEIGQRYKLSEVDALKINRLYDCEKYEIPEKTTQRPRRPITTTSPLPSTQEVTTSSELASIENRRTMSRRFGSGRTTSTFLTKVTPKPQPVHFTRVTSDRWKYLTDRYTTAMPSTTTMRTTRARPPSSTEVSMEVSTTRDRYSSLVPKSVKKCKNLNAHCEMWERLGHCEHSFKYMSHYCRKACGLCPTDDTEDTKKFRPTVTTTSRTKFSRLQCVDKNLFCGYWSRMGECHTESKFMRVFCKRSCGLC